MEVSLTRQSSPMRAHDHDAGAKLVGGDKFTRGTWPSLATPSMEDPPTDHRPHTMFIPRPPRRRA
jgi:hypothetical protein